MSERKLDGYYAVWCSGHEWPELFYDAGMAKNRAEHLAKDCIGHTVHVCQFESVGTVMYPANRNVSGLMSDEHAAPPPAGALGRAVN